MTLIHARLANAVVLYAAVAGLLGLFSYVRRKGVGSNYWGILVVGEILFLAQGVIGALLWLGGERPDRGIHVLYGVVTVLALPAYYAISKGRDDREVALAYGLLCLFLAAMTLTRSMTTG